MPIMLENNSIEPFVFPEPIDNDNDDVDIEIDMGVID